MNASRLAGTALAAVVLCCTLPTVASAADYCVYPNQNCGANNVLKLQDALDLAASTVDADRVLLGEGTYVAPPNQWAFSYTSSQSPVEIVGSGRGKTILTAQPLAVDRVLNLGGVAGSSVHDLTIRIPEKAGPDFRGLLTSNTARRIDIVEDDVQTQHHYGALLVGHGTLEDSSVTLATAGDNTGVWLGSTLAGHANALRGSVVRAALGVRSEGTGAIERSRVFGGTRAVLAVGDTNISDSLLVFNGSIGPVVRVETKAGSDTNVTADGVTIFGANLPDIGGVDVRTSPAPDQNAHVELTNSIVRGGLTSLAAVAWGGGKATISASYSDYDPSGNIPLGASASITESHVWNLGNAGFDETAGHEYELLPSSPLLDKGDPDAPQGLDLNGNPRIADGNGDGYPRHDLGAFELQPAPAPAPPQDTGPAADTQAPLISGFRTTPSVFAVARASTPRAARVARGTRLRYTLSETARVVLKIQRRLAGRPARYRTVGTLTRNGLNGLNRIRFTGRIGRRALRPGRYRAVITATDAAGNRSAPKAASFRVAR